MEEEEEEEEVVVGIFALVVERFEFCEEGRKLIFELEGVVDLVVLAFVFVELE